MTTDELEAGQCSICVCPGWLEGPDEEECERPYCQHDCGDHYD